MQLSSLENKIREKLEERRMKPSDDAWNNLEKKLDGEGRKFKNTYWWIGIAAAILVGVVTSSFFLFNRDTGKAKYLASNSFATEQHEKPNKGAASEPAHQKVNSAKKRRHMTHKKVSITHKKATMSGTKISQVVEEKTVSRKARKNSNQSKVVTSTKNKTEPEPPKILKEVIAENIEGSKSGNKTYKVTTAGIEKLLHKAQLRISAQDEPENSVNAYALLLAVEIEQNKTLKDRVIKVIKGSVQKLGTLLASRLKN